LFAANRFALTKPASTGWRNVGISLKIPPDNEKKIPKNSKKTEKNSIIKPLSVGGREGQRKKDRKIAKRPKIANSTIKPLPRGGSSEKIDRKIALLSLYLLYLYHV